MSVTPPANATEPPILISVDDATHTAKVEWTFADAKGNPVSGVTAPATVFSTPDTTFVAVDPTSGAITPTGTVPPQVTNPDGSVVDASEEITVTNPDGTAVTSATVTLSDGTTATVTVTVDPAIFGLVAGAPSQATATVTVS